MPCLVKVLIAALKSYEIFAIEDKHTKTEKWRDDLTQAKQKCEQTGIFEMNGRRKTSVIEVLNGIFQSG